MFILDRLVQEILVRFIVEPIAWPLPQPHLFTQCSTGHLKRGRYLRLGRTLRLGWRIFGVASSLYVKDSVPWRFILIKLRWSHLSQSEPFFMFWFRMRSLRVKGAGVCSGQIWRLLMPPNYDRKAYRTIVPKCTSIQDLSSFLGTVWGNQKPSTWPLWQTTSP